MTLSALKTAIDKSIVLAVTNRAGQILYVNENYEISQYSGKNWLDKHIIINSGYHEKIFQGNVGNNS